MLRSTNTLNMKIELDSSIIYILLATLLLSYSSSIWASAADQYSFEGLTAPGTFVIGNPPETATFSGDAASGILTEPDLYFTGSYSWFMEGSNAQITFDNVAQSVEFYAVNPNTNANFVITAFDPDNNVLETVTLVPDQAFTLIGFNAPAIERIEFNNQGSEIVAVDDLALQQRL